MVRTRSEAIAAVREKMRSRLPSLHAYIVPTEDPHQVRFLRTRFRSEYIAACDQRRAFISGFTGSAGTAVIVQDRTRALLWTDGRYHLQAEEQVDPHLWEVMKEGTPGVPKLSKWLAANVPRGANVGVAAALLGVNRCKALREDLEAGGINLVPIDGPCLVDIVWDGVEKGGELPLRPERPRAPVYIQRQEFAGRTVSQKLTDLRSALREHESNATVLSALDEVAWLFNIRGSDITHNPVVFSYAVITEKKAILCVDVAKISPDVKEHLETAGVTLRTYDEIWSCIASECSGTVFLDGDRTSEAVATTTAKSAQRVEWGLSPVTSMKGIKNDAELAGMRAAHVRDGAALCRFFCWLEKELRAGSPLTECSVSDKLESLRKENDHYVGLSFDTIAGSGANGAIIHYKPEPATCAHVTASEMFLCDSGAQYLDGTTDVTRTVHLGEPSAHMKLCFTRVLQGFIALASAVFPEGTIDRHLDTLARVPLWQEGLDYLHGTGHGVGSHLNVHEGPHLISFRERYKTPMVPGMVVTNEPGYYEKGAFGIRIENVMEVVHADTPHRFGGRAFFTLKSMTLAPIQHALIQHELLTPREIEWLDSYHREVATKLRPLLDDETAMWLDRQTRPCASVCSTH